MIERRSFITGLISLVAAPAIVRAGSLMPVYSMIVEPKPIFSGSVGIYNGVIFRDDIFWIGPDNRILSFSNDSCNVWN